MATVTKFGADLAVGDRVQFLTGWREITGFKPHPGLDDKGKHLSARIAVGDRGWEMTVFDEDEYDADGPGRCRYCRTGEGSSCDCV